MTWPRQLSEAVEAHSYPLLFATISGAHLYGFPRPDSDWDLRGVHVLPAREVLGLQATQDTISFERLEDGLELDLVTHDAAKFFALMLRRNGYVLEQLHSPLVVHTTLEHMELRELARGCVTRYHAHHYLGFSANQWRLFSKESPQRIKPLLYTFRTLLTGLHLMRTGEIEANLRVLNQEARLPYLDDLIGRKTTEAEQTTLTGEVTFYEAEYQRLTEALVQARGKSGLREEVAADTRQALSDLLVRVRLKERGAQ
ncbi:nucleotidyltransferase [Deinococcus sp. Arct2-2]|uniref:nucleotidyltransferase domain-containing protein n=1 Tax=Deinococcus sp. Arct2-2 TaxID=2568653 RepID=UPI0010A537F4|nr:nucleotidyltransferase domain-containing protein [Deinococcus sp. Arct2-2]THF70397.1 nucleotidyltransferase [Deinococcus sp. Arct2-2]